MSSLSTLPKGDSAWLLRKSIQRIMQQVSVLETNIGSSTTGNSADTQVIFNDAGTLRGDTGLTYDKSADRLSFGAGICYGLLTSASATITGDLTVDTSTLKVDSANNRVGILTASPTVTLDVVGAARFVAAAAGPKLSIENAGGSTRFKSTDTSSFYYSAYDHNFTNTDGSVNRYTIDNNGVSTWYVSGTTAMTLNSTGLGIGAAPEGRLNVANTAAPVIFSMTLVGAQRWQQIIDTTAGNWTLRDQSSSIDALIVKAGSGNLGVGVTPSAKFDVGLAGAGTPRIQFTSASDNPIYQTQRYSGSGSDYLGERLITGGGFFFQSAPAAAVGSQTFTTRMTLDDSGRLILLASTTTPATLSTNGQLTFTATSNTNLRFSYRGSDGVTRTADLTLA